jgi:hypothetical protein
MNEACCYEKPGAPTFGLPGFFAQSTLPRGDVIQNMSESGW